MADLDRGTILETNIDISDLNGYRTARPKLQTGRLEWPIMMIPLEAISSESPAQTRQEVFDPGRYPQDAELAASIRQHGVIEPILVYRFSDPGEDPQYRLIAGDRRRRAAAHIGQEMIPAIIRQSGDQINLLTFAENTGRRDLTPYEKAIALAKIMDMDEEVLSFRQLAKKTGVSLSSVSNLLKAYRESPPALRKLFAEGMESRAVVELQSVFGKYGEAEQVELARKLRGLSKRQVLEIKELSARGIPIDAALETIRRPQMLANVSGSEQRIARLQRETPDCTLPSDDQVEAIAELTGAPRKTVKEIFSTAEKNRSGMDAVFLACAFVGRGGTPCNALKNAESLTQKKKAFKLVHKYLILRNKAKDFIDHVDEDSQKEFLNTIFWGE
jgi:ParB/RepB/Spo0J family partition protein